MYCNACGIFKKTHGVERPLGTSRFKQYAGPGPQPRARGGKRSRGGRAGGGRRSAAGKAGSPGAVASDSEPEPDEASASESEAAGEVEEAAAGRRRTAAQAAAVAPPVPEPSAEEGGARRTTSGRTVRPPRARLGEAAAVTSPDLAAAEAAQLAEVEAVEAIRRQQQLPALPGNLSLFKAAAAPVAPPQHSAVEAALRSAPAPAQQGATLSTSSDASAYSQPRQQLAAASAATAHLAAYGLPLHGVPGCMEAGERVAGVGGSPHAVPGLRVKPASRRCGVQRAWALMLTWPYLPGLLCRLGAAACLAAPAQHGGVSAQLACAGHGAAAVGGPAAAHLWRRAPAAGCAPVTLPRVSPCPSTPPHARLRRFTLRTCPASVAALYISPAPTPKFWPYAMA
jgi:hypothetical protein